MRGDVEVLAGIKGEDIVGPPPLELPLRYEQGGDRCWSRGGPFVASR